MSTDQFNILLRAIAEMGSGLNARMDGLEQRMDRFEQRMDIFDQRLAAIEADHVNSLRTLTQTISDFHEDLERRHNTRLNHIESRLSLVQ